MSLLQTLQTRRPRYIVMYDVDVIAIRQIEVRRYLLVIVSASGQLYHVVLDYLTFACLQVFQCRNSDLQIVVYFPMYAGAVEEQAYLTTLRRERNAFEFLIDEKRVSHRHRRSRNFEYRESDGRLLANASANASVAKFATYTTR